MRTYVSLCKVKDITDKNIPVTIYISSSASKVPSKKDNQDLAIQRLYQGNSVILQLMEEFEIDFSKVNIVLKEASVNGPEYKNDAEENKNEYQKYQFIKIHIEF